MGILPTSNHHLSTACSDYNSTDPSRHCSTQHTPPHKIFSHKHITKMLAFHSQYVHAPKAQACFFNTKITTLIVLGVLVPSPTSSTLLQHNPSYLSDAAENPRHNWSSELPSSSLSSTSIPLPKIISLSSNSAYLAVWDLSRLSVLYPSLSFSLCSFYLQKKNSPPLIDFWSFFSKGPLLLPEASPKHSVPIQSNLWSAVLPP